MEFQGSERLASLGKSVSRAQKMCFFGTLLIYGLMFTALCFQYHLRDLREEGHFCQLHQMLNIIMFASIPLSHLCFRWLRINYLRLWEECYGSSAIKEDQKRSVLDLFVAFNPSRSPKWISNYKTADCGFYLLIVMNGLFAYTTFRPCE